MRLVRFLSFLVMLCFLLPAAEGEEAPYFVTYDHQLEEPGNLEIATSSTMGVPRAGEKFYFAPYVEFEYAWRVDGHRNSTSKGNRRGMTAQFSPAGDWKTVSGR